MREKEILWKQKDNKTNKSCGVIHLEGWLLMARLKASELDIWNYVSRDWHMNKQLSVNDDMKSKYTFELSSVSRHSVLLKFI